VVIGRALMTAPLIASLGGAAALAGAVLLYLASPNQRAATWRGARPRLALAGAAAELAALACFLLVAGPATAVFIWLTAAMLFWSVGPLLTAWRRAREERR
jgi:hypothetical protein